MRQGKQGEIEEVETTQLREDPRNARLHSKRNVGAIEASIKRFGMQKPIVALSDGTVIAGNGMLRAARNLGLTKVLVRWTELKGGDATAYAVADNRTAELAEWDESELGKLLAELQNDESIDELITGFDEKEIQRLIDSAAGTELEEDEVPEKPSDPVTVLGDVWELGRHRLLCGDSTDEAIEWPKEAMCVTDPPYGVNYDPEWRNDAAAKGQLAYAARRVGHVSNDDRVDWSDAWKALHADVIYCWSAPGDLQIASGAALIASGYQIRNQIIWSKPHFPISRGHYTYQHEPCWYAVLKGSKSKWIGDANASSVWRVALDPNVNGGHSTQKPVEIMARPIRNHDFATVVDPFLGSGTTLIACEQLNRTCFGVEIDPGYCDVIVERWQRLTGGKAKRVTKGRAGSVQVAT
jgi:DNA modification methylase